MNQRLVLSRNDRTKLKALARRYRIELVILFGSRARGEAHAGSDLDVGVLFAASRAPSPRALYTLGAVLADLFRDDVDVVPLNFVNAELRRAVEREGQVLYERAPGIFAGFVIENLHRLHQYNYLRQYDREFLDRFLKAGGSQ
jgi:predicted nucleotidyltransferase